jgi:uncharacterized protein HemY
VVVVVLLLLLLVVVVLLLLLLLLVVVMGAVSGSGAISSMRSGRRWESRLKGLRAGCHLTPAGRHAASGIWYKGLETGSDSANSGGKPPSFGGLGMMGLTSTGSS